MMVTEGKSHSRDLHVPPMVQQHCIARVIRYNAEYCSDCKHIHCLVKSKGLLGGTQLLP